MDNLRCWVRHVVEITKHAPSLVISSDEQPGGLFVSSATGELLGGGGLSRVLRTTPSTWRSRFRFFSGCGVRFSPFSAHNPLTVISNGANAVGAVEKSCWWRSHPASKRFLHSLRSVEMTVNSPTPGMETVQLTEWKQSDSRNGNSPTHGMETVQLTEWKQSNSRNMMRLSL